MLSLAALCGPDIWYCGFNRVGSYGDSTQRFSIAVSRIALDNVVPSGAFDLFEAGLSSLAFFSVSPLGTLQFLLLLCYQLVVLSWWLLWRWILWRQCLMLACFQPGPPVCGS